jgi:hypothetical protein
MKLNFYCSNIELVINSVKHNIISKNTDGIIIERIACIDASNLFVEALDLHINFSMFYGYISGFKTIEDQTDKKFDTQSFVNLAIGANEEEIANSGLEETMVNAYNEIKEIQNEHNSKLDLRTAGPISAINIIATSYLEQGISP